jgi:Uma2 family endonuclease
MGAWEMMTSQTQLQATVLELLPHQGDWSEAEYLWLTDMTTQLIEYTDGYIEVLPVPTEKHQTISGLFYIAFLRYFEMTEAIVVYAPLRLRLRSRKFREPDLMVLLNADDPRRRDRYWLGADLVLEIVSSDDPAGDLVEKRRDYAEAGIPEYWIVNPLDQTITVLRLIDNAYVEHGIFGRGAIATSAMLSGFSIDVRGLFGATRASL